MIRNLFILILLSMLTACGQKGPLYLPQEDGSSPSNYSAAADNSPEQKSAVR